MAPFIAVVHKTLGGLARTSKPAIFIELVVPKDPTKVFVATNVIHSDQMIKHLLGQQATPRATETRSKQQKVRHQ